MTRRALLVLVLFGVLCALPPLAHATPPDPTWIAGGFYDDADHDDVILAITSAVSVVESGAPDAVAPLAVCLGLIAPGEPRAPQASTLDSSSTRAPPHLI